MLNELPRILVGFSGNPETTASLDGTPYAEKVTYLSIRSGIGGTSVNLGLQAKELGMPVSAILTVGRDNHADDLKNHLVERGLTCHMIGCRQATSFATVEIGKGGERSIRSFKSQYNDFPSAEVADITLQSRANCVVATGCIAAEEPLITAMFDSGNCLRVLNPRESLCADHEVLERLLGRTDVLCLNEGELSAWIGAKVSAWDRRPAMEALLKQGPSIVIVTRAKEGVVAMVEKRTFHLPSFPVGPEVDGTGAGDAFLAAFLSAYLTNAPVEAALSFASLVAGIKVTKMGGSSIATIEEISQFYPDWSPWKFLGQKDAEQARSES